ncbi:hypothetical protein [Candidatus Formimonas warabiya]|uniref:Uncharacterized protein n=1 Tax=Formimonas warabiya TaxID=1761012 RepID=A0A3G1KQW8_FORW1|nr:hypothetical protein [Candidatus Formimonas warabiya]ATW24872.1 hypothetical protein DCMF_08900 [Candidatus Formimonas warabiya]
MPGVVVLKPEIDELEAVRIAVGTLGFWQKKACRTTGVVKKVFRAYYIVDSAAAIKTKGGREIVQIKYLMDTVTMKAIPVETGIDFKTVSCDLTGCEIYERELSEQQLKSECRNSAMTYLFRKHRYYPACEFTCFTKIYRCFYAVGIKNGKGEEFIYVPSDQYSIKSVRRS